MSQKITSFADVERLIGQIAHATKRQKRGLEHMFQALAFLGNPQQRFKVVHVAGTSGKTSTAYYIAAVLGASGKQVGLTVSPHIYAVNERVQVNLEPLPEDQFCRRFDEFWQLMKRCPVVLNYFEIFMAFAFWEFAARQVDFAVVEVGVGGLLDSTNVFRDPGKACVITDIGYDHTRVLGETIAEIAAHKAGIIQRYNVVFCNKQGEEVMQVIQRRAAEQWADLRVLSASNAAANFGFLPLFQKRNFSLGLAAAQFVLERDRLPAIDRDAIEQAARTYIPGRMEVWRAGNKTIIADIAHNGQKLSTLFQSIQAIYPGRPLAALVRMSAKDISSRRMTAGMEEIVKGARHIIFTSLAGEGKGSDLSFQATNIVSACRRAGCDSFEVVPDPREAFKILCARSEPVLLVTGSAYILEHIRPLLSEN